MSDSTPTAAPSDYAVLSELRVPEGSGEVLEGAFADRLHEVEQHSGFRRLEVWRDARDATRYLMMTWWAAPEDFRAYMRSEEHRRSHARIPGAPHKPKGVRVEQFHVVAR